MNLLLSVWITTDFLFSCQMRSCSGFLCVRSVPENFIENLPAPGRYAECILSTGYQSGAGCLIIKVQRKEDFSLPFTNPMFSPPKNKLF